MDNEKTVSLREVDSALRQNGFKRDAQNPFPCYVGELDKTGLRIRVSIEIQDINFIKPPVIRLLRSKDERLKPIAHIAGPEGLLCYLDAGATILDRYDPGGTVVRCLHEAEIVLRDALRGRSNRDFAGEFLSYWADMIALVDLPMKYEGDATIHWLDVDNDDGDDRVVPLLTNGDVPTSFLPSRTTQRGNKVPLPSESCRVVSLNENLTLDSNDPWPPTDIAAFKIWLDRLGSKVGGGLEHVIRSGKGTRRWLAVKAPNGCVVAEIQIPAIFDRPEFLTNRKEALLSNLLRLADQVVVKRYRGLPVDEQYLYTRNLGKLNSLAGKSIALIGCGTIGGFLAKYLAQSGAGSQGGRLTLVDKETLQPGNIGRHLLGVPDLACNKAVGCRDHILRGLPHLKVVAEPSDGMDMLEKLSRCSLVIDATGEEAFSIALNHHAVRHRSSFPPVLYVWLKGNGSIAQSLLCDDADHACYKCMKPELAGQPRYRAIRSESDLQFDSNRSCGDGLFVAFPVSRSISAAALGLEAALGWINGKLEPRFRNLLLDDTKAFNLKDSNPGPSPTCPACRKLAA